jgi:hypothetical protein
MGAREDRIGLNEAVFREVNERIEDLSETFDLGSEPLDLICECGEATCVERITMTRKEYEQLRSDAHLFAVFPGHVNPEVERLVSQRKGYQVVEKDVGVPEMIAEQTDPRS